MTYRSELSDSIDLGSPPMYSPYDTYDSYAASPVSRSYADTIRSFPMSPVSVELEAHVPEPFASFQIEAHVPESYARSYSESAHGYPQSLEVAPPKTNDNAYQRWRRRHSLLGWKFGVRLAFILTFVVLIVNIGVTVGIIRSKGVDEDGKAMILKGDCKRVKKWNTGAHLIINILSTLILGASNYTMQCLCAPTRSEVDKAHSSGKWLHIGVPSLKNLRFIKKRRVFLWVLLTGSSWPLHLFFNSAVFSTLYAHRYDIYTIEQNFLRSDALNPYSPDQLAALNGIFSIADIHQNVSINNNLIRLDNSACIEQFAQPFQSANDLLLLVLDTSVAANPDLTTVTKNTQVSPPSEKPGRFQCPANADSIGWICKDSNPDDCNTFCSSLTKELKANATNWAPFGQKINHCLVNKAEDQCMLNFSAPIMYIVIGVNVVKVIVIFIVNMLLSTIPIITLGDALATFLTQPDTSEQPSVIRLLSSQIEKKRRISEATSNGNAGRWFLTVIILIACIVFVSAWLAYGFSQTFDRSHVWALGFGAADPRTLVYGSLANTGLKGVFQNAIIANLAQPVLSLVYFTYNSLITAMASAWEWDGFALTMKGLRVSDKPRGEQRTTHFLQLPYRFSILLMLFSVFLHWLISQSIFVVSVYSEGAKNPSGVLTGKPYYVTCGYAPTPMAVVIGIAVLMIIILMVAGRWTLRSNIPFMFSRSDLIARECHPDIMLDGESFKRLQWAARHDNDTNSDWYAFSSLPVEQSQSSGSHVELASNSLKSRLSFPFMKKKEALSSENVPLRHMSTYA